MKLSHIRSDECRICGAKANKEEITGTHSNGQQYEKQWYTCGAAIEFSPNFGVVQAYRGCPKDPDYVARKDRVAAFSKALLKYVDKYKIDEPRIKESLKEAIAWQTKLGGITYGK